MRRKRKIKMIATESAAETYEHFLLTKCASGVKIETIETYSQYFHAISKHLDISQEVVEMTATDLKEMVMSTSGYA